MNWLQLLATIVYAAGLLGCATLVWLLMSRRFERPRAVQGGMALAPTAFFVGLLLAAAIAGTANLTLTLGVYLPYFAFAAWFLYFAQLLARDWELGRAGLRALLLTLPTLLLSPLALGLLYFLILPR